MLTIIESGSHAWAMATANGDLRIFGRDGAGEWSETFLSDDTEQLDESGSLILEALYEEKSTITPDEAPGLEEEDPEAEEDEEPEAEDDEEPEAVEKEPEGGDEAEEEEEEEKPRRRRTKTAARKK